MAQSQIFKLHSEYQPAGDQPQAIAELVEGKGRFIDDIARGVNWFCEARSWAVSAHLAKYQKSKSPLPDPSEDILALFQGNI